VLLFVFETAVSGYWFAMEWIDGTILWPVFRAAAQLAQTWATALAICVSMSASSSKTSG
jgi:hypothetical protein